MTASLGSTDPPPNKEKANGLSLETDRDESKEKVFPVTSDKFQLEHEKADSSTLPTKTTTIDDGDSDELYGHLPPHQAEILKRQVLTPELKQGLSAIYRFSTRNDIIIMIVATVASIGSGAATPLMTIVFGSLQGVFQNYSNHVIGYQEFQDTLTSYVLYFLYLGIGEFILSYVATVGFIYVGEHITAKIREEYLQSCLRQNVGFFDAMGTGEIITRITSDTNLIQDGISQKVSLTLVATSTFVTAFVIGFIYSWKLTLILSSAFFALVLNMMVGSRFMLRNGQASLQSYALGGSLADEVIGSIRSAIAFGAQDRLAKQYSVHLTKAEHYGFRTKATLGIMISVMMLVMFLNHALAFWQGSIFLVESNLPLSNLLTILIALMMGEFGIGQISPYIQAFTGAISAASKIFDTIDRESPISYAQESGDKLDQVVGHLLLKDIQHIYPSRPGVLALKATLDIPAGKSTALVGASGSGKSTIIGLLERFYDPVEGTIFLDGHDISKLNLRWLRQHMALVSQEPVLFGTTIYQNIRYGLLGTNIEEESDERQKERIYEAAAKANAHNFITSLPDGYETRVGERGILLSGGQKQRIAIARAIVSEPKILLLDEATSALDTKSEGIVQAALKAAGKGRTLITVAHRLSTIRDANNIVVMSKGEIVEQGTHLDLLAREGTYCTLVRAQNIGGAKDPDHGVKVETEELEPLAIGTSSSSNEAVADKEDAYASNLLDDNVQTSSRLAAVSESASITKETKEDNKSKIKTDRAGNDFWSPAKLVMSFNTKEWKVLLVGMLFCVICGGAQPAAAILYAKQVSVLSKPLTPESVNGVKSSSDFLSAFYVLLAGVLFVAFAAQGVLFAKSSERLVHRLREHAFRTILRQDIAFFDREENSAGALTSFLSTETTFAAALSGVTLGTMLTAVITLISVCTLALAVGWELSLVCISTIPVLLACGFFRVWILAVFERRSKAAYSASASLASEAISAIRTVAVLNREEQILNQYRQSLAIQQRKSLLSVSKSSLLFASTQSLVFLCFALGFWWGGTLIGRNEYSQYQFFLCFMSVTFGAQATGSIFSFAPDMGKAYSAARELKTLFERKPTIDTWSNEGASVKELVGAVEFRDVHFQYPNRPDHAVLRGLDLVIQPGQHIALVGASGCGKSTTIALLERFYDLAKGRILVDGQDISTLNVNQYRSFISLVSQEPTLYQGTIRDNVAMGSPDDASQDAIDFACREANIYDFIVSLPDGFSTVVGTNGSLLSGGQKQRIAIARALIRDPRILLLDEATSALDSASEDIVQKALDKAAKGRTTITVAHRLSTIQGADIIYVFDKGRVAEAGTHEELVKKNGRYAELVSLQNLTVD